MHFIFRKDLILMPSNISPIVQMDLFLQSSVLWTMTKSDARDTSNFLKSNLFSLWLLHAHFWCYWACILTFVLFREHKYFCEGFIYKQSNILELVFIVTLQNCRLGGQLLTCVIEKSRIFQIEITVLKSFATFIVVDYIYENQNV